MINTQNLQIKALYEQGYTAQEIARGLNLNDEAVALVVTGFRDKDHKVDSFKARFGDVEELALATLKDICANGQNESARTMSAKILLEKKAALNSEIYFDYDEIAERLARSKKASSLNEEPKIVVMQESVN